jgi:hypothetical protein
MSMSWHQLLRRTWRDVTRQIDITLRHHDSQDYDTLYKEVSCLSEGLTVHTAESLFLIDSVLILSGPALPIQLTINEIILRD